MTILISSHILDEIEKMVTHIGVIHQGKLLFDGSLKTFKEQQPPHIILKTSDDSKVMDLLQLPAENYKGNGVFLESVSDQEIGRKARFLIEQGVELYRIEEEKKSLEEVFISMTGKGAL
ncbi:MAG: hypothetical protein Q4P25_01915 [Tissierellia bacterium]|nr:hypothetical protein [Tissierellia bacterium]